LKLTCDSAGAHLEVRLAWRRHCRAGEAKVRAANILNMCFYSYWPIEATDCGVAVRGGCRGRQSGLRKAPPTATGRGSRCQAAPSYSGISRCLFHNYRSHGRLFGSNWRNTELIDAFLSATAFSTCMPGCRLEAMRQVRRHMHGTL
jgi:hypothetical protein